MDCWGVIYAAPTCTRFANRTQNPCLKWQRGYYDRVIRNEYALGDIQQYIQDNPTKWDTDENNPARIVGALLNKSVVMCFRRGDACIARV